MPLSGDVEWNDFVSPFMCLEPLKIFMFSLSGGWWIQPVGGMYCQIFPPSLKEYLIGFKHLTGRDQREQHFRDYKYQQGRYFGLLPDLNKLYLIRRHHIPQHHHWVFHVLREACFKTGSVNQNWLGLQSDSFTVYGKGEVYEKGGERMGDATAATGGIG